MNIKIKHIFSISFVFALLLCIGSSAWALTPTEAAKLLATDALSGDYLGRSVSISGNTALVGANGVDDNGLASGAAYVFTLEGGVWTEQAKLTASDGAAYDIFGITVSISGDTALVGAYGDDDLGANSGSVYVFVRDAFGVWTEQAKLNASDGVAGDRLGYSLSISGDTALIGANYHGDSGAAYVFVRDPWGAWTEQAKLGITGWASSAHFGISTSVSGDTALIGAFGDYIGTVRPGAAYVYTRAGGVWTEQAKLTATDWAVNDNFGVAVSLDGDTALIGAHHDKDDGPFTGSAYIFTRTGSVWNQQIKFTASDGATYDYFGASVSLSGDNALIGAWGDDDNGSMSGSAYLFSKNAGAWGPEEKFSPVDGAYFDSFGKSVSLSGDTALLGTSNNDDLGPDSGLAYVYSVDMQQPPTAAACTASPPDMVAWWKGDGDATDSVGSNDGTLTNGAAIAAGAVSDAFSFDGMDDYVGAPSIASLVTTNQITIQAWVKPTNYNNAAYCCAHIVGLDYAAGWGTHLAINPTNPYLWSSNGIRVQDSEPLALNTWHHIVATYDGTTAKLYVNGVLKDTHNIAVSIPLGDAVMIGASNTVQLRPFAGLIDEVEIYSRALSASEILAAYNAGDKGHCENQPPVADAGIDKSFHVGSYVTLDGFGSSDPESDYPLTYLWTMTSKPAGSVAFIGRPGAPKTSFLADRLGNYTVALVVTDSLGNQSAVDTVIISSENTAPVADAGEDIVLTYSGEYIQLDGTASFDSDGDPIIYRWRPVSRPAGSSALLNNPTLAQPTFRVDVKGEYVWELRVRDAWVYGTPDTVTASYSNLKPVAIVNANQTVVVGSLVYVSGYGSDPNRDYVTYEWGMVSAPDGSAAVLVNVAYSRVRFLADMEGTYVVNLVVSDSELSSDPASATITVISARTAVIDGLNETVYLINEMPPQYFRNIRLRGVLTNTLGEIMRRIDSANRAADAGAYLSAYNLLERNVLPRVDGCTRYGRPDSTDWIVHCPSQREVYNLVVETMIQLRTMF